MNLLSDLFGQNFFTNTYSRLLWAWRTAGYIDELAIHKIKTPNKTMIKPAKWRLHRRIDNIG